MRTSAFAFIIAVGAFVATYVTAYAQDPVVHLRFSSPITPLEAIKALGIKTHVPIAIVPGRNTTSLCGSSFAFDFEDMPASAALAEIAHRTQYSLTQQDGVSTLRAPDLTPHQIDVLHYRLTDFGTEPKSTMHQVSFQIYGWLWSAHHPNGGYAGSILDSPSAPKITLPLMRTTTPMEIADAAVSIQPGGMWISKIHPDGEPNVNPYTLELESYGDENQLRREITCAW